MSAISSQFYPTNCKEAISDHRFIKPVIDLAKKIRGFVSDIFYTFCYFAFPSMRSRPFEIWGRYDQMVYSIGKKKYPTSNLHGWSIICGNKHFFQRSEASLSNQIEQWFKNAVTYANRARSVKIELVFYHKDKTMFGKETNTQLGTLCFQSRGKEPKIWEEK